ncbi:MAG: zinc ribbon domain-containing protein [Sphaerochaetaceae bacterium]|jgi:uncharacterized protein|nr:zinc ribbon domain-containing protein [Sphaerochaetaceae bacterium]NLY06646.1 DNA-binding protein [Spirochaetales bacterium]
MDRKQYVCPKCGNMHYIEDKIQTAGGNFSKLFDIQNKRFVTISCTQCGYTELFRQDESVAMNVLDFLIGN